MERISSAPVSKVIPDKRVQVSWIIGYKNIHISPVVGSYISPGAERVNTAFLYKKMFTVDFGSQGSLCSKTA